MPPCSPESSFPRSTGSVSTTPSSRTWSTASVAARASASRREGSAAAGAKTTPIATTGPNGQVLCQEMEKQEGKGTGRERGVQGSLCLGCPLIHQLDPIRGERTCTNTRLTECCLRHWFKHWLLTVTALSNLQEGHCCKWPMECHHSGSTCFTHSQHNNTLMAQIAT